MRRTPEATAPSETTLKSPIWPVAPRWVPPQSSVEKSPMRITRTRSPYFSPNSAIAPLWSAACRSISDGLTAHRDVLAVLESALRHLEAVDDQVGASVEGVEDRALAAPAHDGAGVAD